MMSIEERAGLRAHLAAIRDSHAKIRVHLARKPEPCLGGADASLEFAETCRRLAEELIARAEAEEAATAAAI